MPNSFILAHIFVPCQLPLRNILNNPIADIYLQLVNKHHCPKSTEGKNAATTSGLPLPASKSTGNSSTERNTPSSFSTKTRSPLSKVLAKLFWMPSHALTLQSVSSPTHPIPSFPLFQLNTPPDPIYTYLAATHPITKLAHKS